MPSSIPQLRVIRASWTLAIVFLATAGAAPAPTAAWRPLTAGLDRGHVAALSVGANRLYAATLHQLYRGTADRSTWSATSTLPGQPAIIAISIDPARPDHVWVATDQGLFDSTDAGASWQRRFRGKQSGQRQCLAVLRHPSDPQTAVLGTADGVLISRDSGANWQEAGSRLRGHAVRRLALQPGPPDRLYALTDHGLFVSQDLLTWEPLFRLDAPEVVNAAEATAPSEEETLPVTALVLDPSRPGHLYLAGPRGVHVSRDAGRTWQPLSGAGGPAGGILELLLTSSGDRLYAATDQGMYLYDVAAGTWQILSTGLPSGQIRAAALSPTRLLAGTDDGVYALALADEALGATPPDPSPQELLADFAHEPSIRQVHDAAIRTADVDQRMIRRWRRQASLKALLPSFSVGWAHDRDTYLNGIGSTTNPAFDRILSTDDPSSGVDLDVNWDLGDLIWNDDQTSIDTRSRLLVQLRDDILADATRAYFERRRLQLELLTDPPADPTTQVTKELRLQELTAMLDGLTGGWFSDQLAGHAP
jgi:photosystem II stability/assembly factor-like uncharacterized protein